MAEVGARPPEEPGAEPSSLARLVAALAEDDYGPAVRALAGQGINTPLDLHFTRSLAPHADLPNSTIHTLRQLICSHLIAPPQTAQQLYSHSLSRSRIASHALRTGLRALDAVLAHSGYPPSQLIQLSGPSQSFRTLLGLHAVLSHLILNPDKSCCWIGATDRRDEDVRRAAQVTELLIEALRREGAEFRTSQGRVEETAESVYKTLERVEMSVHPRPDAVLSTIDGALKSSQDGAKLSMVVVDGVDLILGDADQPGVIRTVEGHATLVDFMRRLRTLTRTHNLTIFLINSTLPSPPGLAPLSTLPNPSREPSRRPALGVTFSYMPDLTLLLERGEEVWGGRKAGQGGTVEVVETGDGASGGWVAFKSDGISLQALE